jgi:integrase
MGRRRKSGFDLPPRLYKRRASYWYTPRGGKPINLGKDLNAAKRLWAEMEDPAYERGSLSALLDWYLGEIAPRKAPRTYRDNQIEAERLKKALGHIPFRELRPHHVATYRDERAKAAPIRANREKALLSHVYTKAMERGWVDQNPCIGVKRNTEAKRARYIDDAEYHKVFELASEPLRNLMTLIYRTAQRLEDILKAGPANIDRIYDSGQYVRVLKFRQGKTGKEVKVQVVGDIAKLVDAHLSKKVVPQTFVHGRAGKPYTPQGIGAMFRRLVEKAGLKDFGPYDLKGKAATDMYRQGDSLERIQELLGHTSVTTTERYIKARFSESVRPNLTELRPPESASAGGNGLP